MSTNGQFLVSVGNAYFRLVTAKQTNQVTDAAHIEVEILTNSVTVDGLTVTLGELSATLKARLTSETEVWIHDASDPGAKYLNPSTTGIDFQSVQKRVYEVGLKPDKVYTAILPKK